MKFVVSAAFNDPDHLLELAVCAEECGFEAMAFPDHVVHPEKLDTPYPYTADGSRRWSAFTPWVDPWVAIAACAAVTTRLRFTNNVFVLAMRNPFLAAKAIATAAVLSRGRVTLTLGVGWSNVEYRLLGQDFRSRGKRTDEMIDVLRKLWTGEMVSHEGAFYRFDPLESNPAPPARIPIWVGGISDAALRRAARNDGWLSDLQSTAEIEACIDKVRRLRGQQRRYPRADASVDLHARRHESVAGEEGRHAPVRRRRDRKDLSGGATPWPRSSGIPMARSAWSSATGSS